MEVLFSTNDLEEFKKKENILKNSVFDFTTIVNDSKYELLVDENIYEEAGILLNLKNIKPKKSLVIDDAKNFQDVDDVNQKKGFLYYVNQFYKIKYSRLVIVSLLLSFVLTAVVLLTAVIRSSIETQEISNEISELSIEESELSKEDLAYSIEEKLEPFIAITILFLLSFVISQAIIFSSRYYRQIGKISEVFVIRIGKKPDYDSNYYKVSNFLGAIIGNIAYGWKKNYSLHN